jgi:hypothetical protein
MWIGVYVEVGSEARQNPWLHEPCQLMYLFIWWPRLFDLSIYERSEIDEGLLFVLALKIPVQKVSLTGYELAGNHHWLSKYWLYHYLCYCLYKKSRYS